MKSGYCKAQDGTHPPTNSNSPLRSYNNRREHAANSNDRSLISYYESITSYIFVCLSVNQRLSRARDTLELFHMQPYTSITSMLLRVA